MKIRFLPHYSLWTFSNFCMVGAFLFGAPLQARPSYPALVPNAAQLTNCGVCHIDVAGGGIKNNFGSEFGLNGHSWAQIRLFDSDGDGQCNAFELGDTDLTCSPGGTTARTGFLSFPGDHTSKSDAPHVTGNDRDCDGILDDGNGDNIPNEDQSLGSPCTGGNVANCDDNCCVRSINEELNIFCLSSDQ